MHVIRYRTKPEQADENQRLVEAVFEELKRNDPGDVRYASFRLEDGTFIHMVDGTSDRLTELEAFAKFQAGIADRCAEQPVRVPGTVVASYRFPE